MNYSEKKKAYNDGYTQEHYKQIKFLLRYDEDKDLLDLFEKIKQDGGSVNQWIKEACKDRLNK